MLRLCLCRFNKVGSLELASAVVITDICSTRRCAGITRIVTSLSIPKEPSPRRARRNASPRLDSVIFTTTPNLDGVTSVSEVMNSSTGGIDEPVPCAPAETTHLPAVQQYLPDLAVRVHPILLKHVLLPPLPRSCFLYQHR